MNLFIPAKIFIERTVADHPNTVDILSKFPKTPVELIETFQTMGLDEPNTNRRFNGEKKQLILAYKQGELVKEVQRDLFRDIPNEYYIVHSQGCPFDCQYCFLYDYLGHQIPTIFVNTDDIVARCRSIIEQKPDERLVFHTGEFSDALAYDHITDLSRPLIELFAQYDHAFLELRTKSDNISNLLGLEHKKQSIVSWTFSPQRVVQLFEYRTATADERIDAARRCQEAGYPVALRFDPMVRYPGWEADYQGLVFKIGEQLNPDLISDCHLGVFRYTAGLGRIIRQRFPNSWLRAEESVPSADGKHRYFKPLRLEMYHAMSGWLHEVFPDLKIELCMESPEVEESLAALSSVDD